MTSTRPTHPLSLFHNANDFLRIVESEYPIRSHANFQQSWSDDVRQLATDSGFSEEDLKALDASLAVREKLHTTATGGHTETAHDKTPWEWLLHVPQIPQRTTAWYEEKRSILTASEVATIFKGGRTRGSLVMAKAQPPPDIATLAAPRLAVERRETTSLDWGVRYEPVVKQYLERSLDAKILDLGRIRHRSDPRIAASPDGIFTECKKEPQLAGRLVEIKCPSSRIIKEDSISFEYWCQMQLQMEVCDRGACEFVEVKFRELKEEDTYTEGSLARGWITLEQDVVTGEKRYQYHDAESPPDLEESWARVETYPWEILHVRRVTVARDPVWFQQSQSNFEEFWRDVEAARAGTFEMPPARTRKLKAEDSSNATASRCAIVDDDVQSPIPEATPSVVFVSPDIPEPPSYTDEETKEMAP